MFNKGILNKEIYLSLTVNQRQSYQPLNQEQRKMQNSDIIEEIITGDKLEYLQRLVREKNINSINTITRPFIEVNKMIIPIISYSIIQKAIQCFKYLLICGIDDPTKNLKEENPKIIKVKHYMIK